MTAQLSPTMLRTVWNARATVWAATALLCLLAAAASLSHLAAARRLHAELVSLPADAVLARPDLRRLALAEAPPLYEAHCAACHGPAMQGRSAIGAPNLTDASWLYGTGRVADIERTVLFGVRAGGRARNVAEMPAYGQAGLLKPAELRQLVAYMLSLNGEPADPAEVHAGAILYQGRGYCADCHGGDARGAADYGAPSLIARNFTNGRSPAALYDSLYFGRHNAMQGFYGRLSLEQIRALAVLVATRAHPP